MDNASRISASTVHTNNASSKVRGYSQSEEKNVEVDCLKIVQEYNQHMGGTDRQNQNVNKYRIGIRGKKWYWCIFTWLIDVTEQNAWLLHKKSGGELSQFEFKTQIAQKYLTRVGTPPKGAGGPPSCSTKGDKRVLEDICFDGLEHYLMETQDNKRRCAGEGFSILINKTHVERVRPRLWRQQDTQPVPKPKEENAYRPIALITCTEKVAERMVLNRLKWKIGKLHHRLYAFTDGVGTHECITDLMATINESHSLVVFLDLEKAFELASSAAILFSLVRKRVRGHLLSWVQEYTRGREARVTFQGATSPFLPLENGTPQGGILSPFLFNVLVENLLLIELPQGIEMFIYADDICIVCPHSVRIHNQSQKMQRALNAIVHECNELGLKINPLKTRAMAIKYFEPPPPLFIGNNPIEFINLQEDLEPPDHYIGKLIQTIRDVNIQLVILDVKHDKFHPEYVPPAPWSPNPIDVNYTVLPAFKSLCTPQQLKSAALASIADTSAANVYFTDGSVDMNLPAAGSAVFSNTFTSAWRLSDHASILQAELYAIAKALENSLYKYGHTTIHTDSKGAIQSILKRNFKENIHLISTIKTMAAAHAQRNRKVTLNWIPSHVGIHGNDEADRLANSALSYPTISRACRPSLSHIKKLMSNYCHLQKKSLIRQSLLDGSRSAKWYTEVTNIIPHSMPKSLRRQLTTILFRLRLGYLCSWQIISIEDRFCPYCDLPTGTEPLEHYLLTCTEIFPLRQSINLPPPYTAVQVTKHILDNTNTLSGFLCSYPPPR
ncbi:uncharacterized protein [Palaemon carinicauda]|uniref:uncharacterized protein n=1 Tax=Palaemon carinicauda TaxID=392227 RepID=UPI0035B5AD73